MLATQKAEAALESDSTIAGSEMFEEFLKFHRANPSVFMAFAQYAFQAIQSGRERYSARAIMERVRWSIEITSKQGEFKINNNHVTFYARLFEATYPAHAGFFERRSKANAAH